MQDGLYRNEFAAVQVGRDESGNGVRLRIEDLTSGRSIYLDPLELEALTWMDHRRFGALPGAQTNAPSAAPAAARPAAAPGATPAPWEQEWERVLAAAKQEGTVAV